MRRFAVIAGFLLSMLLPIMQVDAQIITIRVNRSTGEVCVATPTGVMSSMFCEDGNDGGGTPPTAPQLGGLVALNFSSASIPLQTACTGGTPPYVYELQFSITNALTGFTVFDSTTDFDTEGLYTATGLVELTQYWFKLSCVDDDSLVSAFSSVQTVTTPADTSGADVTAPTLPTGVTAVSTIEGEIFVDWIAATDAVGVTFCNVLRGNGDGAGNPVGTGSIIAVITGTPPVSQYNDTGLTPGAEHYYKLRCGDAAGNIPAAGTTSVFETVFDAGTPSPGPAFNEDFETTIWMNRQGWGNDQDPNGNPANGKFTRVCTTSDGVVPRDGCMGQLKILSGTRDGGPAAVFPHEVGLGTIGDGDQLYARRWISFGNSFSGRVNNGKAAGGFAAGPGINGARATCVSSQQGPCNATNGWSLRNSFSTICPAPNANHISMSTYAYHDDMTTDDGEAFSWSGIAGCTAAKLDEMQWYCVEEYVQMNTGTNHNGISRVWVDGNLVLEKTDWRLDVSGNFGIGRYWINWFHGGGSVTPVDLYLFVDDIAVDDERIGCN